MAGERAGCTCGGCTTDTPVGDCCRGALADEVCNHLDRAGDARERGDGSGAAAELDGALNLKAMMARKRS